MSTPDDAMPAPDGLHDRAQEDLAAAALGQAVDPAFAAHIEACPLCQREVASLRSLVERTRSAGRQATMTPPPARVWQGIVAELQSEAPVTDARPASVAAAEPVAATEPSAAAPGSGGRPPIPRPWPGRRAVLAVLTAVAVAAAGVVGWSIGSSGGGSPSRQSAQALLAPQPGAPSDARGEAFMQSSPQGYTMTLRTDNLPPAQGYYEVWLYNPSIDQMVAIGTLGIGAEGTFTLPGGIDVRAYHVVDVSAQRYNGNNQHERSVLRGSLGP